MSAVAAPAARRPRAPRLSARPLGLGVVTLWLSIIVLLPLAMVTAPLTPRQKELFEFGRQRRLVDEPVAQP